MKPDPRRRAAIIALAGVLCAAPALTAVAGPAPGTPQDQARRILQATGIRGGLVAHLGCGDGTITAALHADDRFLVHGLDTDAGDVALARKHIDSLGLYGRVSAETYDGKNLPYGDNIVNLLVVEEASNVPAGEIARVLVPSGVVVVRAGSGRLESSALEETGQFGGWRQYAKPWPKDIDEWTHYLHDASGNAVARDTKVGRPHHVQWQAGPKHSRHHDALASLSAMTSSGGRLFYIYDEGPVSIMHRPPRWKLIARDAFNGKLLWKRAIPTWMTHLYNFRAGPKQLPRRLVSVGDNVYATLGLCAPAVRLDAATGRTEHVYEGSENTEELLHHDGMLLAVVGDPGILMEKADGCHGYWEMAEYEEPTVEKAIVAWDAASGKPLWRLEGDNLRHTVPLSLCALGEDVFYLDNNELHCLDAATGRQRWASPFETSGLFIRSYAPTVVAHGDVIMCLKWNRLCAYAIATGEPLWETKGSIGFGSPGDLFAIGETVWTNPMRKAIWRKSRRNKDGVVTTGIPIPRSEFLNEAKTGVGIDLHTGEVTDLLPFAHTQHHHRCYRDKASEQYIFVGHSGIQVVDLKTKQHETNRWVRGICQYGIMPANGYLYVPPDPCQCYSTAKINGFFALADSSSWGDLEPVPAVEKGPAYGEVAAKREDETRVESAPKDEWPTYRGNHSRSGSTPCDVPETPRRQWRADIGKTMTAPVVAAGKVFLAQRDAYTVHCLDAGTGRPIWKYLAGGPVDSPPTLYKGLCIFGCGDGSVYCLDAASGRIAWRFKTSTIERRIGWKDRLASPLRIHGSVLVQNNVVYFAAGYSSNLDGGIRLYGLDVWTGKKRHEGRLASGYWGNDGKWGFLSDILASAGKAISMRGTRLDEKLQRTRGGDFIVATTGLLDDTWFHRQGWQGRGAEGQLLVFGDAGTFSVNNPYTRLKQRRKGQYKKYNQVGHLHQKFARYEADFFPVGTTITCTRDGKPGAWAKDEKFQPRAMVLAGQKLCLAGWLDDLAITMKSGQPKDPLHPDPREPVLQIFDAATGERLSEVKLEAAPVFDGLAAACGRLFLSLKNGRLLCMGR